MELVMIKVNARANHALAVQEVLTKYGCVIKVRLGLHEIGSDSCSNEGLIILQVTSEVELVQAMMTALKNIEGVVVKTMSL